MNITPAVIAIIAKCIRDVHEVPSGHLYAQLMGRLSLDEYQHVLEVLLRAKLITNKGHLLTWVGPQVKES